jgi:hypothetical protein
VAGGVEFHEGGHDEAIFAGLERAHAVRKGFGKHGNGAVGKIDGRSAEAGFLVERGEGADVVGDVSDVDLEVPTAVGAMLDVNGVVEVAGGFAVDGDDGEMAEIFAACAVGVADGNGAVFGVPQDFGGKRVREMVLANDDFGVDAEFAGAAENFDDAADGSLSAASVAEEFDVDDGAFEFRELRKAAATRGFFRSGNVEFFAERGSQLVAGRDFDFVVDARVVGQNDVVAAAVAEEADDGRMSAAEDADDAAFGAARSSEAADFLDFGEDVVAVHGVFDVGAGDEEVAVELGDRSVGDDEAVAVMVEDEAPFYFVAS